MKTSRTDTYIILALLILTSTISMLSVGQTTLDIQLHDTYIVLDKVTLTFVIFGPLALLVFFVRGWTRRFNTIGANIGLLVGLVLLTFTTYAVAKMQHAFLTQVMTPENQAASFGQEAITKLEHAIGWTWGLFGFWILASLILVWRTVGIWKEENASR